MLIGLITFLEQSKQGACTFIDVIVQIKIICLLLGHSSSSIRNSLPIKRSYLCHQQYPIQQPAPATFHPNFHTSPTYWFAYDFTSSHQQRHVHAATDYQLATTIGKHDEPTPGALTQPTLLQNCLF